MRENTDMERQSKRVSKNETEQNVFHVHTGLTTDFRMTLTWLCARMTLTWLCAVFSLVLV